MLGAFLVHEGFKHTAPSCFLRGRWEPSRLTWSTRQRKSRRICSSVCVPGFAGFRDSEVRFFSPTSMRIIQNRGTNTEPWTCEHPTLLNGFHLAAETSHFCVSKGGEIVVQVWDPWWCSCRFAWPLGRQICFPTLHSWNHLEPAWLCFNEYIKKEMGVKSHSNRFLGRDYHIPTEIQTHVASGASKGLYPAIMMNSMIPNALATPQPHTNFLPRQMIFI